MDVITNRDESDGVGGYLTHPYDVQGSKIYLVEFIHKESGKSFYKIGVTDKLVSWRFDCNIFKQDRCKYIEFNIIIHDIIHVPNKTIAEKIERKLREKFPKNFYLEQYLNKPYNHYRNGFTGISETFIETNVLKIEDVKKSFKNVKKIVRNLYNLNKT